MIPKEDVVVVITKEGYVKRVSLRSYSASDEETTLKENDFDSYIIDEKKVLHLARYLPIRVLTLGDCGFEGIDSLKIDNSSKSLS